MPTPGEEIRNERMARGWSQEKLAREAGVSSKTVGRIEREQDYDDPRSIPAIRSALGLDGSVDDLRRISDEALAAEVVRRLMAARRILDHDRIRRGDLPEDFLDRPNIISGPPTSDDPGQDTAEG